MTILWFVVWLLAELIGDLEALRFDPPNWSAATLILAIALDINRPQITTRRTHAASPRKGSARRTSVASDGTLASRRRLLGQE